MELFRRLERALRPYAVPHLTVVLIASQVLTFAMTLTGNGEGLLERLALVPNLVMEGQVWRLITFLTLPPEVGMGMFRLLFLFFAWYLFYLMGTALEHYWGVLRYNAYLLIWYVATVATAFLVPEAPTTNVFLYTSVFLAFAYLFPDFQLLLMFILPVKIKWLALLTWLFLALGFWGGAWSAKLAIVASVLNFLVFFGKDLLAGLRNPRRRAAGAAMKARHARAGAKVAYHHRCTVCGKTDQSDPQEDFRYCSKCVGQHAYCSEHLRDHAHIEEASPRQ